MRTKRMAIILVTLLATNSFALKSSVPKQGKLLARYEMTDSGTSMTLDKANKNVTEAENRNRMMLPLYFSPLVIVLIVVMVKRRRKRLILP
ncbi:MAG TPA: hypothetical protein VK177_10755 [Flavobacteriales bacterium]|nr:hypothetical protein [Flavobacteriales bacterium]